MIEKLMLHLQYEAEMAGIKLPLDAAVKRLHPGSKEGAAIQQLAKLRTILLTEGHMVPPKAKARNKRGPEYDPQLRGYIRPEGAGPYETRIVGWGEKIVDLTKNIENPGIYRGSGKYPRQKKGASQLSSLNEDDQVEYKSDNDSHNFAKPRLIVTIKINPKHLAKIAAGTGNYQAVHNDQKPKAHKYNDEVGHHTAEVDIPKHHDIEALRERFNGTNDDEADQKPLHRVIKGENFNKQDSSEEVGGFVDGAGYSSLNKSENWPKTGHSGNEVMQSSANVSYGSQEMMSYESAVGSLVGPSQSNTFSSVRLSDGFSGNQPMYSSAGFDQYNMYKGMSLINAGPFVLDTGTTMGFVTSVGNGDIGMATQLYPAYPYYQVRAAM